MYELAQAATAAFNEASRKRGDLFMACFDHVSEKIDEIFKVRQPRTSCLPGTSPLLRVHYSVLRADDGRWIFVIGGIVCAHTLWRPLLPRT